MWRGFSTNRSIYMVLSENPLTDSIWAFKKFASKSSSDLETRIPFPPPPLDALIITGKPTSFAVLRPSSTV